MDNFWVAPSLILVGSVFYQIAQKCLSGNSQPFFLLAVAYAIGAVVTGSLSLLFEKNQINLRGVSFPLLFLLAGGFVCIELGYFLGYRNGWKMGLLSSIMGPLIAICLIASAILFFKEKLSMQVIFGIALGCVSVYFMKQG